MRINFLIRIVLVYTASSFKVSNQFTHHSKCATVIKAYAVAIYSGDNIPEARLAFKRLWIEQKVYFDLLKSKIFQTNSVANWHTKWGPWNIGSKAWEYVRTCAETDVLLMYTDHVFKALNIPLDNLANDRFLLKDNPDKCTMERIDLGQTRLVLLSDGMIGFMDKFLEYVHEFYSLIPPDDSYCPNPPSDRAQGTMKRCNFVNHHALTDAN